MRLVTELRKRFKRPTPRYFGLNELDKKLERYVDYDGGFYVELGANDGQTQSNSYYFELNRGWRGILIEPAPHNFLKCLMPRGENNQIHCNACVGFDYRDKFVELTYADLMSVPLGLDSDLKDPAAHIASAQEHLREGEKTFAFGAVAVPLNRILERSGAPKLVDFLSLDVEGAEMEVLKGVDHSVYRFKYMLVECRDIERLSRYLNGAEYEQIDRFSDHDYLFRNARA